MNQELLFGAVVHDLKNQLLSLTSVQEQAFRNIPEQYHSYLQPIAQRVHRLKNDTMQMMTLFSMEQNQTFPLDENWPKDSVNAAIEATSLQFPLLTFVNNIDDDCQGFYNEALLHLALITAITNSAQAGATKVTFTANDQDGLTLTILDNGPGFNNAILSGSVQTTKVDGSGLGLYFIRLIAEHHKQGEQQGTLKYGNNPSGGAFLEIFVP